MLADNPNGSASSIGSYGSNRWFIVPKTAPAPFGSAGIETGDWYGWFWVAFCDGGCIGGCMPCCCICVEGGNVFGKGPGPAD